VQIREAYQPVGEGYLQGFVDKQLSLNNLMISLVIELRNNE
jgi:hypothetical protein